MAATTTMQGVCELVDSGKGKAKWRQFISVTIFNHGSFPLRDVQQPVHGFGSEESGAAEVTP